jgi:hypothetical protein
LREADGLDRTSGITSGLVKMIGVVSLRTVHHLATQKEELLKIGTVHFKRLVTLLHPGVEDGLEDVALVEVVSVVAGVFTLHARRA